MSKTDEYLELMNAYKNGRTIQWRHLSQDNGIEEWHDIPNDSEPGWQFSTIAYRIKPETLAFTVIIDQHNRPHEVALSKYTGAIAEDLRRLNNEHPNGQFRAIELYGDI